MSIALSVKFDTLPTVVEKGTSAIRMLLSLPWFSDVSRCCAMLLTAVFATSRRELCPIGLLMEPEVSNTTTMSAGDTVVCDEPDCVPVTFRDRS